MSSHHINILPLILPITLGICIVSLLVLFIPCIPPVLRNIYLWHVESQPFMMTPQRPCFYPCYLASTPCPIHHNRSLPFLTKHVFLISTIPMCIFSTFLPCFHFSLLLLLLWNSGLVHLFLTDTPFNSSLLCIF